MSVGRHMISHMNPEYCNCHWWISAVTYYYIYSLQITHFFSTSSRLAFHSFPYRCAFISWWYFVEFEFNHTLHLKMISCLKNLLWKSLTFNTIGTGAACMILHTVIWEYGIYFPYATLPFNATDKYDGTLI